MCGIVGYVDFSGKPIEQKAFGRMTYILAHRGPDDRGVEIFPGVPFVALGHRRLAIIDLSPAGHQPMSNEDGTVWIVYNGEIYNFREIREDLEKCGHVFKSNSDTEVIIHAYEEWGEDCLQKFNGMFAFGIWDENCKRLFLARDRIGIKPLFYYHKNGLFAFASELKSLMFMPGFDKTINLLHLRIYLALNYIPAPFSIFEYVGKLLPGHYLIYDLSNRSIKIDSYWRGEAYRKTKLQLDEDEALQRFEELLKESVRYRLISDVPVGVFLSGGIDSSTMTAIMTQVSSSRIKTFSIGFNEEKYNEAHWAKRVAEYLGTEHHERYLTWDEALKLIPELAYYYDEPFADPSAIPTILVSRLAREHVKVVLSGDGGDELFGGYQRYRSIQKFKWLRLMPYRLRMITSTFLCGALPRYETPLKTLCFRELPKLYEYIVTSWRPHELDRLLPQTKQQQKYYFALDSVSVEDCMFLDLTHYLPNDILTKVDRASMSTGLEARVPLLDHNIVELVLKLPFHLKYRNGIHKYLLRQALYKLVPKNLLERPKMGFAVPLKRWLKEELRGLVDDYLNKKRIEKEGIFDFRELNRNIERFYNGDCSQRRIWSILMFQMWAEKLNGLHL